MLVPTAETINYNVVRGDFFSSSFNQTVCLKVNFSTFDTKEGKIVIVSLKVKKNNRFINGVENYRDGGGRRDSETVPSIKRYPVPETGLTV